MTLDLPAPLAPYGRVDRIEVSPDGRQALAVSRGRITAWELPGGKAVTLAETPDRYVLDARFSPDGKRLASLVMALDGKPIPENYRPDESVTALELWDAQTAKRLRVTELHHTGNHGTVAFRPGGRQVAVSIMGSPVKTLEHRVSVVDAETGRLVRTFEGKAINEALAYSPDGSQIMDAYGTVIDIATGAVVQAIPVPKGQTIFRTARYPDKDRALVFRSKTGSKTDYKPGELVLFDLQTGRELKKLDGVPSPFDLAVSADGRWLMALNFVEGDETAMRRELIIRNASTWELVLALRDPPLSGRNAVFTKDSNAIVVGKNDRVCLIEIPSGRELKVYGPLPDQPLAVTISPDGRFVASTPQSNSTGAGTSVHVWDAASGAEVHRMSQTGGEWVSVLSFSPDGRRLVSGGSDGKVNIWDTESGLDLLTLAGHKSWLWQARFSPDGQRIVTCSRDGTLRIWDGRPIGADAAR